MERVRREYLLSPQYIASPKAPQTHVWKRKEAGHIVSCRTGGVYSISVLTIIGKVSEANLFVDKLGGWSPTWKNAPMDKAKYQFQLERDGIRGVS